MYESVSVKYSLNALLTFFFFCTKGRLWQLLDFFNNWLFGVG